MILIINVKTKDLISISQPALARGCGVTHTNTPDTRHLEVETVLHGLPDNKAYGIDGVTYLKPQSHM